MPQPENNPSERRCTQCGAELPANLPPDLCPKCLLKLAMDSQPEAGPGGTVVTPPVSPARRGLPQPGEQLGHYQIVRPLGGGGMGAVFEADDLENGRRVALKVLSQALDAPDARERFFREGRLAASLNHPNSVYVFGTEEIGGTPVIAMELVSGGTLEDYVRAHGPMQITEAVDAVLDIIAGLEAAQRVGILHRDVKPSNCFREPNGAVKIGDFGLSISTALRAEPSLTASGSFLGTPAFCPPEQVRGEELNARSDMYSVGATLFYLLTGRTPFEGKGAVALIAAVLEQPAPSPSSLRPSVPKGLARVVLRCLEKQPSERFKTYRELTQALAPYGSTAPTPATLGLRFLAGALDTLLLSTAGSLIMWPILGGPMNVLNSMYARSPKTMGCILASYLVYILYYALQEGTRGATLGKTLCRLRVAGPDKNPPRMPKAFLRAFIYVLAPVLPFWLLCGGNPKALLSASFAVQQLVNGSLILVPALLFSTMRRRNGFAAVHDLLTNTRVLYQAAVQTRPALGRPEPAPLGVEAAPSIGPYHVLQTLERSAQAEWLLAYDLRLLRKVWVRKVAPGTPPVPPPLRNLGRVGRLRWLAARRAPQENWDAFEAPPGQPLLHLASEPQPWSRVRFWLYDLARELEAARKDGTLPEVLGLDRVWVTNDGQAKLLDFPAPGLAGTSETPSPGTVPGTRTVQQFLDQVAAVSLAGRQQPAASTAAEVPVPLPLHARRFLQQVLQFPDADALAAALRPLLGRVAEVTRWRRGAVVGGCLAFPLLVLLVMVVGVKLLGDLNQSNPGLIDLATLLQIRAPATVFAVKRADLPSDRQFAIYIARHYRAAITNASSWSSAMAVTMIKGEARKFAEQSLADYPAPSEREIQEADAAVGKLMPKDLPFFPQHAPWSQAAAMAIGILVAYVGFPAVVAALLFRGGLVLLIARVTFVRKDGLRASRLRVFWRALVAWSILGFGAAVFMVVTVLAAMHAQASAVPGILASCFVPGCLVLLSLALPTRGLQDRIAGTWPVPR